MSDADFLEAIAAWASHATANFTAFATFTFAYLTACYFVGKSLTRFQVYILSGVYLGSAVSSVLSVISALEVIRLSLIEHPNFLNDSPFFNIELWMVGMIMLAFSGIVASLAFMHRVRQEDAT